MSHPMNVKEVQRLVRRIVALSKFILCSTDRCAEVFKILKNYKSFNWTLDCVMAFEDLKSYITSPLILLTLEDGEELYPYLAISAHVVSSVLIRVVEGT